MNKCIFQYWEESERGMGVRPGGCSIHSSLEEHTSFINDIYITRTDEIPNEYDRIVGDEVIAFVPDKIYDLVEKEGTLKLSEPAFQNLLKFDEIIFNTIEI